MAAKRTNKLSRAAHIKRNTRGTSNELSFSVLDAAKNALDEGKDIPTEQSRRFGRISLFTLPLGLFGHKNPPTLKKEDRLPLQGASLPTGALQTPSTVKPVASEADAPQVEASPVGAHSAALHADAVSSAPFEAARRQSGRTSKEEIAWRKGRRRRHRVIAIALAAVLVAGAAGAGVWYLYNDNQRFQEHAQLLGRATDELASTDELVASLDEVLTDPLGEEAAAFLQDSQQAMRQGVATLQGVQGTAERAMQGFREENERGAAEHVIDAAEARQTMLTQGMAILQAADGVNENAEALQSAWDAVVDADSAARESSQMIGEGGTDAINASKEKTQQALDGFSNAQQALTDFANANPDIQVDDQLSYVSKRIEAMEHALASDEALLQRDVALAQSENDAYNAADQEAASLAAALPSDPEQPVLDDFQKRIESLVEAYENARGQASSADAFLRDYLGASTK